MPRPPVNKPGLQAWHKVRMGVATFCLSAAVEGTREELGQRICLTWETFVILPLNFHPLLSKADFSGEEEVICFG